MRMIFQNTFVLSFYRLKLSATKFCQSLSLFAAEVILVIDIVKKKNAHICFLSR